MLGQEQKTKPKWENSRLVDPGLERGIKNERSNEARVSKTTALSRDEIFMFKSLFFSLLVAVSEV